MHIEKTLLAIYAIAAVFVGALLGVGLRSVRLDSQITAERRACLDSYGFWIEVTDDEKPRIESEGRTETRMFPYHDSKAFGHAGACFHRP